MSAELDAKWLELVAAGKAEWAPGMRAIDSDGQAARVVQATGAAVLEDVGGAAYPMRSTPPDWSDAATLGALLGQVRTRYMDPTIYARPDDGGWTLYNALGPVDPRGCRRSGLDEASALLYGLELAP